MWTKAKESALKHQTSPGTMTTGNTNLSVDNEAAYRDQLSQLRQENAALKEALDEVCSLACS